MATYIKVDLQEVLRLIEIVRTYEALTDSLIAQTSICQSCHEAPRVGNKYCAECQQASGRKRQALHEARKKLALVKRA